MKVFVFILLALPALALGALQGFQDASSTNIPTAYTTAGGTLRAFDAARRGVCYQNNSATAVYICFNSTTAASCSNDVYVAANSSFCYDFANVLGLFHKSTGSAISSGINNWAVGSN